MFRKRISLGQRCILLAAMITWLLPMQSITAWETRHAAAKEQPSMLDVRLTADGILQGEVLDGGANGVANQILVVARDGQIAAKAVTDADGRFWMKSLRGGIYQIALGDSAVVCRLWTHDAAPPIARDQLTILSDSRVVRGQRPIGCLLDPLIVGLIVAAAIAIPIAIHNSDDGS